MKDLKYMGRALAALAVFGMALPNAALRAATTGKSMSVFATSLIFATESAMRSRVRASSVPLPSAPLRPR